MLLLTSITRTTIELEGPKSLVTGNGSGYTIEVIKSFKHKGMGSFYYTGSTARIKNEHAKRLRLILGRLEVSITPTDMNLPGLRFHELKGKDKGRYSVRVSGNWRVTFGFDGLDAVDVNYEDYH